MLYFTVVLALLAGTSTLAVGLRGRRVDDHPLCRRCRFDLTGRPADSTRCPECGADLGRPKAVRVGHWERRPRPLTFGLAILLPTVAYVALNAVDDFRDLSPNRRAHLTFKVFVDGDFDLGHTGHPNTDDAATVRQLVIRSGGILTDKVTVDDDFVILGVEPMLPELHKGSGNGMTHSSAGEGAAQEAIDRYQEVRADAMRSSVPLLPADRLLRHVGYYDQNRQ